MRTRLPKKYQIFEISGSFLIKNKSKNDPECRRNTNKKNIKKVPRNHKKSPQRAEKGAPRATAPLET